MHHGLAVREIAPPERLDQLGQPAFGEMRVPGDHHEIVETRRPALSDVEGHGASARRIGQENRRPNGATPLVDLVAVFWRARNPCGACRLLRPSRAPGTSRGPRPRLRHRQHGHDRTGEGTASNQDTIARRIIPPRHLDHDFPSSGGCTADTAGTTGRATAAVDEHLSHRNRRRPRVLEERQAATDCRGEGVRQSAGLHARRPHGALHREPRRQADGHLRAHAGRQHAQAHWHAGGRVLAHDDAGRRDQRDSRGSGWHAAPVAVRPQRHDAARAPARCEAGRLSRLDRRGDPRALRAGEAGHPATRQGRAWTGGHDRQRHRPIDSAAFPDDARSASCSAKAKGASS